MAHGGAVMSLSWNCEYDPATEWAEYQPKPQIEGNAIVGLINALMIEVTCGGLVWMALRLFR